MFLSLLSKVLLFRKKLAFPEHVGKILVLSPPRIGDVALCSAAPHALKSSYPHSELHVLANKHVAELFSLIPDVDSVFQMKSSILNKVKLLSQLRQFKYHLLIDLNFDYHFWPSFVAASTGAFSVGYQYAGRGFAFSRKLPQPKNDKHATAIFLEPVVQVIPSIETVKPHIAVPDDLISETQKVLTDIGILEKEKVILIHPGAHHPTQRWLPEYFAETADKVIEAGWARLIFVGGPNERELIEKIQLLMTKEPDTCFVGLGIKDLIGLIHRADLMICNNSGPLHIAVSTNTQTVSTMGPTIKKRWMPVGDIHKVLRIDNLPCIGCNLGYCKIKTHDCMRLIRPSMVLAAVKDLLLMGRPGRE